MRTILTLGLLCAALTACSSSSSSASNTSHPVVNDDGTVDHPGTPSLPLSWSLSQPSFGNAFLTDNLLFSGQTLRAMNLDTRKMAFDLRTPMSTSGKNYVRDSDHLIARSADNQGHDTLIVLSLSGQVLNTIPLPGPGRAAGEFAPTLTDQSLYVDSGPMFYKYNRADLLKPDAKPVWVNRYEGSYDIASYYVKDDDHIFIQANDGKTRVLSLDHDGKERWGTPTGKEDSASQAFSMHPYKNSLIIEAGIQGFMALDMDTGKLLWDKPSTLDVCSTSGKFAMNFTVAADKLLVAPSTGTCVMAYEADTGKLDWVFNSPNRITFDMTPLYLNGVVYAMNSLMFALDVNTGKLLAQGDQYLDANYGNVLTYDPRHNEILEWGLTGLYAYKPVK